MPFPPSPVNTIDWKNLGFTFQEVTGHIESRFSLSTGEWTAPEWVTDPYLRVHGMCPGLNYGQQAFEGVKAFRTPDNRIAIFRPDMNAARLQHSNTFISMPEVPTEHFLKCLSLAVGMNACYVPPNETGAAMYIRPIVYGSSPQLGLNPPEEYTFCVFVLPTGVYHGVNPIDCLILEEFDRTAPRGTGSTKVGGNYAPVLRWSEKAKKDGYGITLHLDSKTCSEIDEFSTAGFIGIKNEGDQIVMVVPDSKSIIKSCTSESVQELARSFGWTVEKRAIPYSELSSFTEVMAAGTAAALVPVKSITMGSKNDKFLYSGMDGNPGPAIVKLLHNLKGIQLGKLEDKFGWRYYVDDPSEWLKSQGANGHAAEGIISSVDRLP